MTDEDIDRVETILDWLLDVGDPGTVLLLSPSFQEFEMLMRKGLAFEAYGRRHWDLSGETFPAGPTRNLAVACNVFMCSPDPLAWMRNIARRARTLLIQDLIRVRRTDHGERAWEDGDIMRYSFTTDGVEATAPCFDMSRLVTVGPRYFYPPDGAPYRKFVCAVDLTRLP